MNNTPSDQVGNLSPSDRPATPAVRESDAGTAVPNGWFAEEIARGAAFLDERVPDWRAQVDLERLYMPDPFNCVIGQVCGNYYQDLDMSLGESTSHGFNIMWSGEDEIWDELTAEWREYIEATR